MSTFFSDSALTAAVWMAVKASVVLGVAAIVQAMVWRRVSAATRHHLWTLALLGALLLPVLSVALPEWTLAIPTAATSGAVASAAGPVDAPAVAITQAEPAGSAVRVASPETPRTPDWSWSAAMAALYVAGVIVMLMQLTLHRWRVRRLARTATAPRDPEWMRLLDECARRMHVQRAVRLLRSRERAIPMAFGTRRPSILIPAVGDAWPDDRRRAVLLHELAHVARHDCLVQTLAFVTRALYWFHPGVWWVVRRLRIEQELACDDRVIAAGTQPREYAGHLLEIAYSFGGYRAAALALGMARPRQLESRLLAVLDEARNRTVPAFRVRLALAAFAAAMVGALAGARPAAVSAEASLGPAAFAAAPTATPLWIPASARDATASEPLLTDSAPGLAPRLVAAAAEIVQDNLPGTWEIRPSMTEGTVHLRLTEGTSSSGSDVPIKQLEGLTAAQLAAGGGAIQFRLRRDAGTFTFEGVLRNGVGAGTFSFTPDPNFPAELGKRGLARPTAREQYQMARHDIGYAFVEELNKQGYSKPQIAELVRAGQHGVQLDYLREMGALGYRLGALEPLIALRDHGVAPDYIRQLADLGYKGLPADALRRARDHGVTPEYIRSIRDAGYASLSIEQLVEARDHGVTGELVGALAAAGQARLPLEQVIRTRDHGVSPDYVRDMRQLGYAVSAEELVRARDHGVGVDFVRGFAALGYRSLSLDALVRLRDHGVTPDYAQELKALGYDSLAVEDLVTLRDHGLTPDRIRAANARAGTRLPIDMLKSLAAGGIR